MTIAFDFDGVFTADALLWFRIADLLLSEDHTVIVVTARGDHRKPKAEDIIANVFGDRVPVLRSYDQSKVEVARLAGYEVDVWIDDEPWKVK